MADLQRADQLLTIDMLDLSSGTKQCNGTTKKGRRCLHRVKLRPNIAAQLEEERIVARGTEDRSASDVCSASVEKLLRHFFCGQHGPERHPEIDLNKVIRHRWRLELNASRPECVTVDNAVGATSSMVGNGFSSRHIAPTTDTRNSSGYYLRSTKHTNCSDSRASDAMPAAPVLEFVPMKKPRKSIHQKLLEGPESDNYRRTRDLYAFSRLSSPGKVKLGTSVDFEARLKQLGRICHYEPILKYHVKDVHCAMFIEGLIHLELSDHWLREVQCKDNPNCTIQHKEWFDVDDATAIKVINNYVQWMTVAKPYDIDYRIKPEWREIIENMERNDIPITAQRLLNARLSSSIEVATPAGRITPQSPLNAADAKVHSSVDATPTISFDTTAPVPAVIEVTANVADLLSTLADIISSLSSERTHQLRELLDQRGLRDVRIPLPHATPVAVAA